MKKIAIVTQPLQNNYGGLLQNFALQKTLKNLGWEAVTIDYMRISTSPFVIFLLSWIRTVFLFCCGKKRRFAKYTHKGQRCKWSEDFVFSNIRKTNVLFKFDKSFFEDSMFDAVVVGSDQVWRPKYNYKIENSYLSFLEDCEIKKIAYAASFGVDCWEYTAKQTKNCARLIKKFNAISVREMSAVSLCRSYLGVEPSLVLDPTFLLKRNEYEKLCDNIPICTNPFLAAYILDMNDNCRMEVEKLAQKHNLELKIFLADSKSTLSVVEWIAMFRDASYIVTNSFHGVVFSIIFGKKFKCLYNENRGASRFESLLNLYNSGKLDEMREFSLNWLKNALES